MAKKKEVEKAKPAAKPDDSGVKVVAPTAALGTTSS